MRRLSQGWRASGARDGCWGAMPGGVGSGVFGFEVFVVMGRLDGGVQELGFYTSAWIKFGGVLAA